MSDEKQKTIVSSWNEWDPLKHVIIGRADGTMVQAPEPAVQRDWAEDGFPLGKYGPYPQDMVDRANEQMDNFAEILEARGIRVDRPTPIDFSQKVQTPDWEQETMFGCGPIRDILLTVGPEILEATMSYRSRWFEFLCYRPLFEQYFKEDPNFRFEAAPKPRLTNNSYKEGWWDRWNAMTESEQFDLSETGDWILSEQEPLFDAADVVRFGKDLIVQKSMVTNDAGIDWLGRHFPDHRVHKVGRRELLPWHLDSTLVPFRPGFALVNPTRPSLGEKEWEFFKKNDWELVEAPKSLLKKKQPYDFCSWWLNMNTLSLGPDIVCVEASEEPVMELLTNRGFEVVPVPFYDVSAFGGGLHCCTADVYREGEMEDYFPNQIEGF
jgi:glycine amidinotransferase